MCLLTYIEIVISFVCLTTIKLYFVRIIVFIYIVPNYIYYICIYRVRQYTDTYVDQTIKDTIYENTLYSCILSLDVCLLFVFMFIDAMGQI